MLTTKQVEPCPVKRRKLARSLRAVKKRKEARAERQRIRQEKLTKTVVATAVSSVINRNKVITYEDLDGDQLVAYHGIHEWWNVQSEIGGVSDPLSVGGYAGCFDRDTEFFSQRGWVKFDDYREGDLVGQYSPDGEKLELVEPLEYIKKDADTLTEFKSQGVDQCLSLGHRVVYWTHKDEKSEPKIIPFHKMKELHLKSSKGWSGKFKTTFKSDEEGVDISEGYLRLQVAVNADGRVVKGGRNNYTQMRFKKERKYLRLVTLCKKHSIPFKDNGVNAEGYYDVTVYPLHSSKRYDKWYYKLSQRQLEVVNDEVVHWDGTTKGSLRRFTSVFKCDADFIQYVFASTGQNTSISKDTRRSDHYTQTGECFTVNGSSAFGNGFRTIQGKGYKTEMSDYKTLDGKMYCFSVPTGMLVVRRNDKIVVSGNTGKSTLLAIALPVLKNSDGSNVRTKYCAYTGKASNVLAQKGLDSQTIHSLIYNSIPNGDEIIFVLKEQDEIEAELIVVDEASMVPDYMRKDLESLGIPILYTGDHGQLPPIAGQGNVMDNPIFKLETPHRQALESGIIEIASMVRNRKRVKKGTYGKYSDATVVGKRYIDDVDLLAAADMVICYTNSRRHELNKLLRRYYGFEGIFPKVGERLICVKNNKLTRMFNGLIVQVKAIKIVEDYLVMDVVDEVGNEFLDIKAFSNYFQGDPHPKIYGRTLFDVFEFAYAITGHKSQGSQWDNVIVIEESMFNQSLDIKRRWMYTTLTRAAKKLTWISKNN